MLKLKRVEIQGFKSFYERTEMKFSGSGIAAVVGPNGCGKSNLSDAISWVLGEQSAKSLRGARMEDVIFAGTREKKPLSMAAVTITLVPGEMPQQAAMPVLALPNGGPHLEQSQPPIEALKPMDRKSEVTITRRLYRSGDSEYLINGKTARLRDIQDLFLGTGLGPESYAIIEQGRIGQILSNKPQDRRNVIEEAAGITKFKTRKRLAEAKLESAKQNLSRVFDILEEVNRQVNSLKRQAAKTKRYSELKAEGTGYLSRMLVAKFQIGERETAKLAIELNFASAALHSAQVVIAEHEKEQSGTVEASYVTEQALTQSRKNLADFQLEAERARGKVDYQAKQIQQIEGRVAAARLQDQMLARQQAENATDLARQREASESIEGELGKAREQLAARAADRQQVQNRLAEQERGLEATRQRVLKLLGESASLKNRITQWEAQLASVDRDTIRAQADEGQSDSDLGRVQSVKKQLSEQLAARQTELISVTDQRTSIEQKLTESRGKLAETRQSLDRSRTEFSRVKARRDSLEEVIEHRSYTTEAVKRLFTAVERGKTQELKPLGVLADFLEVDPQFERATEEFLHEELEYVVVRDWAEAEHGVELMRGDLNGRATFLVASTISSNQETLLEAGDFPAPVTENGRITKLTDTLRFSDRLGNIPLDALPRIDHCYLAADRELANRLAIEFPQCWFLAVDGVSYHGRAVSGGKKTGAGPLALKRELREVSQLEQTKGRELTELQAKLAELEGAIVASNEQLERLRSQQQKQEKDVLALDHETRKAAEEFQRVQARLSHARLELDRLSRDRVKLHDSVERDQAALTHAEAARGEQEEALESARDQLRGLQGEAAHATEEHASLRAGLASLEERQRSAAGNWARLDNQLRDLTNRRAQLQGETQRLLTESAQFVSSNSELQAKRAALGEVIEKGEQSVAGLAAQEAEYRVRMAGIEDQLKRLRAQGQTAQDRRSELQVALARAESELKHLDETCVKELETTLAQLAQDIGTVADEAGIHDLDAKYLEVRRKIDSLGPVNPQAVDELDEAQQRQEFLDAQRQDLLDSIRDTEKAIHEIDGESRKRFNDAFRAINANFSELFQTLFGGGVGEMRLNDEENAAESGIDIVASPPGKRLQSVLLLSGGEKSLTAMALLMAIFQYTPSPFCVLDEVDAPLDEPNIERLTTLIKEMAAQTQFIVITHSKRTMEAAQSLYGVTMQEPGVSKLVSVRFKDVEEHTRNQSAGRKQLGETHFETVSA